MAYTYRDDVIRLISARSATKRERKTYDFSGSEQGAIVKSGPGKIRITIRIDTDVPNWFRDRVHDAGGGNYQTLINEAPREYIGHRDEIFERVLRKVIREELETVVRQTRLEKIGNAPHLEPKPATRLR